MKRNVFALLLLAACAGGPAWADSQAATPKPPEAPWLRRSTTISIC